MAQEKVLIEPSGRKWQQCLLKKIAISAEFPGRLRMINFLRKLWNLKLVQYLTPSGLKLILDPADWVQSQIFYFGNYETKSVGLVRRLAGSASVIFDIGAHIGQYALECAQADIGRGKQIYAIEVNPKTFTYLLNNIQINNFKNVKAVFGAVTLAEGIVPIHIPAYWNMGNTQIGDIAQDVAGTDYFAASFRISDFVKKFGITHIDLIKMDVEGQECDVLEDLFQTGIYPANIIFEYIPEAFKQAAQVLDLFVREGYTIMDIEGKIFNGQPNVPEQNLWAQKK